MSVQTYAQNIDTLRVHIMTPYQIRVNDDVRVKFDELNNDIIGNRLVLKSALLKKLEEDSSRETIPDYALRMRQSEIQFSDSIDLTRLVTQTIYNVISYRLYRPFKIKPRLVLIETNKLKSNEDDYRSYINNEENSFVINIPAIRFYSEGGDIRVQTHVELFSSTADSVIYTKIDTGLPARQMTNDIYCTEDGWNCAIGNSIDASMFPILSLIAEYHTMWMEKSGVE